MRQSQILGSARLAALALLTLLLIRGPALASEKVTLAQAPSTLFRLPLYVAQQKGFFVDEGIDLRVVDASSASNADIMLASGTVAFMAGQVLDAVQLHRQRIDVVGAALFTNRSGNSIVIRKAVAGQIKSMRDLKGRTLGVLSVGSGTWQFALYAAKLEGSTPKDFLMISTGGGASAIAAVRSGRVDAMSLSDPENLKMVRDGDAKFLIDMTDEVTHQRIIGGDYLNNELVVLRSYAKAHPEIVQAMVNAIQRALNWSRMQPAEEVAKVLTGVPAFSGMDHGLLTAAVKRAQGALPKDVMITRQGYDNAMKLPMSIHALDSAPPFDAMVDNSFVRGAVKKYPPNP